jgi:hypothetical protein
MIPTAVLDVRAAGLKTAISPFDTDGAAMVASLQYVRILRTHIRL